MHPHVADAPPDPVILEIAVAAMQLRRPVDHLEADVAGEPPGHDVVDCRVDGPGVQHCRRPPCHQPRLVQSGRHAGGPDPEGLEPGRRTAERAPLVAMGQRRRPTSTAASSSNGTAGSSRLDPGAPPEIPPTPSPAAFLRLPAGRTASASEGSTRGAGASASSRIIA